MKYVWVIRPKRSYKDSDCEMENVLLSCLMNCRCMLLTWKNWSTSHFGDKTALKCIMDLWPQAKLLHKKILSLPKYANIPSIQYARGNVCSYKLFTNEWKWTFLHYMIMEQVKSNLYFNGDTVDFWFQGLFYQPCWLCRGSAALWDLQSACLVPPWDVLPLAKR